SPLSLWPCHRQGHFSRPGARLRLTEATSVMGGSQAIPSIPDVTAPTAAAGPIHWCSPSTPLKQALHYRANLSRDSLRQRPSSTTRLTGTTTTRGSWVGLHERDTSFAVACRAWVN